MGHVDGRENLRRSGAALACGMIALMSQGLLPLLLGRLSADRLISEQAIGLTAGLENLAITLVSALAGILMPPRRLRLIAGGSTLLLVTANLSAPFANGETWIVISRVTAGIAEGLLFWVAMGAIARSEISERAAAIMNLGALAVTFAAAPLLSQLLLPRFGIPGGFGMLALVSAVGLILAARLPNSYAPVAKVEVLPGLPTLRGLAALALVVLFNAAGMGFVVFIVPLAAQSGLSSEIAGQALMVMVGGQVAGAGLAAVVAGRIGYFGMLICSTIAFAVTWPFYAIHLSAPAFIALSGSVGLITFFAVPFQFALATVADPSRRAAVLSGPALMLGATVGPLLAAVVVAGRGIGGVLELGLALLAAAAIFLIGLFLALSTRQQPAVVS